MRSSRGEMRDTVTGAVVVLVAVLAFSWIYAKEDALKGKNASAQGYLVSASFNRLDGISVGSDVRISGVSVGKVMAQRLSPDFRAVTMLSIANGIELPADTAALIRTDGLLGDKFIDLQPGGDEKLIPPGGAVVYTQDAMVIEDLLDMIIKQGRAKRGLSEPPSADGR